MKHIFLFLFFLQISFGLFAQQKNYKITYRHCFQRNSDRLLEDTIGVEAILIGNSLASSYSLPKYITKSPIIVGQPTLEEAIKSKYQGRVVVAPTSFDSIGNIVFHDKKRDSIFVREKMTNEYVLTAEKTPIIDWQINSETKPIRNHDCQKATAHFRGRNYVAWFAKDLPIADGPWKFYGLPGLVMDITDDQNQLKIYVEKIEYPSVEKIPAFVRIGKKIPVSDYFMYLEKCVLKQREATQALLLNQENIPQGFKPQITASNRHYYSIEKNID